MALLLASLQAVGLGATFAAASPPAATTNPTTIAVGNGPNGIVSDGVNLWVANSSDTTVTKINPSTGAVLDTVDVGQQVVGIAYGAGSLWVLNGTAVGTGYSEGGVTPIDVTTDAVGTTVGIPKIQYGYLSAIGFAAGKVWAEQSGWIFTIDPTQNPMVATWPGSHYNFVNHQGSGGMYVESNGMATGGMTLVGRYLWLASFSRWHGWYNYLITTDPPTMGLYPSAPSNGAESAWGATSIGSNIWMTFPSNDSVQRVTSDAIAQTIQVGSYPTGITADGNKLWVANSRDNTVSEIDTSLNPPAVIRTSSALFNHPESIAVANGSLWVTNAGNGTVTRIGKPFDYSPRAPMNVTATNVAGSPGNVLISWDAPLWSTNPATITNYSVANAAGTYTCAPTTDLTCTITGVAEGTRSFWVTATNIAGTSAKAWASPLSVAYPPSAPRNVTATNVDGSPGSVVIAWSAPTSTHSGAITNYSVANAVGTFTCAPTTDLTCTITGVAAGNRFFWATATNIAGTSAKARAAVLVVPAGP